MKPSHALIFSCLLAFPAFGAQNNPPPPTVPKLDIRLTHKGFKTDPENFVVVCNSAAMAIARYYPKRAFKPILIPKADNGFPVIAEPARAQGRIADYAQSQRWLGVEPDRLPVFV